LWNAEEKILGQFSKIYRTFYPQKMSLSFQKYGFAIREKTYSGSRILDPGVKKAPDPGSGSRIRIRTLSPVCEVRWKLSMDVSAWPETDSSEGGYEGRSRVHLCEVLHNPGHGYRQLAFRTALVQHLHQKEKIIVSSIQSYKQDKARLRIRIRWVRTYSFEMQDLDPDSRVEISNFTWTLIKRQIETSSKTFFFTFIFPP
jgi:hypothetical protein